MLYPPPSIFSLSGVKLSESVDPAKIDEVSEALSFFRGKSWMFVGIGSDMNIKLFVADVQIATNYHSFALRLQGLTVFLECLLIFLCFILQSLQFFVSSAWNVNCHHIKELVLEGKNTALLTVFCLLEVFEDREREKLGKYSYSRISCRDLAKIPIPAVSLDLYGTLIKELFVYLCLIDAEDVRHVLINEIMYGILVEYASDAIDIPHCNLNSIISLAIAKDALIRLFFFEVSLDIADDFLIEFSRSDLLWGLAHYGQTLSRPDSSHYCKECIFLQEIQQGQS